MMSGPTLELPPSLPELAELARVIADRGDPRLMQAFLCSVCRSTRAAKSCRQYWPAERDLVVLRRLPRGAQLIASSRKGAQWLRRRLQREKSLDDLFGM